MAEGTVTMKEIAITENHLYQKTFRRGRHQGGRYVTVWVLKDLAARRLRMAHPQKKYVNRIGLSVPKREDGAIGRNRTKRIIREGLRAIQREGRLRTGYLLVITTRPGIEKQKSQAIEADLRTIFRKLDMYKPEGGAPAPVPASGPRESATGQARRGEP
jgi:ribonuclease P protein component